jgi:hypothetical protein
VAAAALKRWAEEQPEASDTLSQIQFQITDLPDGMLGMAVGNLIMIDATAAGAGWFIDSTPLDDREYIHVAGQPLYLAKLNTAAANDVDLLSVLMHEIGHVLGLSHSETGLMGETLAEGVRLLPADAQTADADQAITPDQPKVKWHKAHSQRQQTVALEQRADWLTTWLVGEQDNAEKQQKAGWKITLPKR